MCLYYSTITDADKNWGDEASWRLFLLCWQCLGRRTFGSFSGWEEGEFVDLGDDDEAFPCSVHSSRGPSLFCPCTHRRALLPSLSAALCMAGSPDLFPTERATLMVFWEA